MKFLLQRHIWAIFPLLNSALLVLLLNFLFNRNILDVSGSGMNRAAFNEPWFGYGLGQFKDFSAEWYGLMAGGVAQEAINTSFCTSQEKFHAGRNISDTRKIAAKIQEKFHSMKFLL